MLRPRLFYKTGFCNMYICYFTHIYRDSHVVLPYKNHTILIEYNSIRLFIIPFIIFCFLHFQMLTYKQ